MHNICHCSNPPTQYVKCQFSCTIELNVLQRLKPLFSFPFPTPVSIHHSNHCLSFHSPLLFLSTTQNITSLFFLNTSMSDSNMWLQQILNTMINLRTTSSEWFIINLLFMCDVQTVAMNWLVITDMPAAVKAYK